MSSLKMPFDEEDNFQAYQTEISLPFTSISYFFSSATFANYEKYLCYNKGLLSFPAPNLTLPNFSLSIILFNLPHNIFNS